MGKFIAAMDNSGGSAGGVLDLYGQDWTEENKMERINDFRVRMIGAPDFNSDNIWAGIVYQDSVERGIVDVLKDKDIETYLKVDSGCNPDGTLKDFPLNDMIMYATHSGCTGTKMRSVIDPADNEDNRDTVVKVLHQQFEFAKFISDAGLMPIVEPEINIHHTRKADLELVLEEELHRYLGKFDGKCILKLTIPELSDFYCNLLDYSVLSKIVALSGGYTTQEACKRLSGQRCMSASFSRALAEGLQYNMTDQEFNAHIGKNIENIVKVS
jgi:fructose-bisphosphate aldolase class I